MYSSRFNIPGSDVAKGEMVVPYLQPVPPKGVGYQRHVFLLFKQDKLLDFSQYKVNDR
jgi:large subunit ribosomal protein L38